jgi:hypothetical protein
MINVRVVRGPVAGVGAAVGGASSLVLLNAAACAVPQTASSVEGAVDINGATSSALTAQEQAGTGTLSFQYGYGPNGGTFLFNATNSTDEFVRVGETMTAALPAWFLWSEIHANDAAPDVARAKQLTARLNVLFQSQGQTIGSCAVSIQSWAGDDFYVLTGTTTPFTIPAHTDALGFEIDIGDAADATKTAHFTSAAFAPIAVFGGELPKKHAIFDNDYSTLRQRVVEGGNVLRGADVVITYTDWRANTVVDSYSLDRNIGNAQGYSRFGSFEMPINGDLAYEVSFGWFADDGGGWRGESLLPSTTVSRLLGAGRTAFETTIFAAESATKLDLYFHVKVFLVVDYTRFGNVTWRRYNQGDRILLRDRWDNYLGQPYSNYELPLDAR